MKTMMTSVLSALAMMGFGADVALAGSPAPVKVYSQPGWCTWCPTPTRLPDGRFALVHSRWPEKCGFESWCMKSEIALAVADSALGPYRFVGTLLGGAGTADAWDRDVTHNPYLFCHGGKCYLYYMGTRGTDGDRRSFLSSQRIGVAVADKAEGPWRRAEKPVFPEDPRRAMCSNPSVCAMPDGRILMVYKWMVAPWSTRPEVHLGAAIAPRPEGPFEIVNENVFPAPGVRFAGEDPCLWTEGNTVVCVIHDMGTNYSPYSRALVRFESEDGVRWTNRGALLARGDIHRLERPYVLALPEGERLLFAASKPSAAGESSEIVAYPGLLTRESVRAEVSPRPETWYHLLDGNVSKED